MNPLRKLSVFVFVLALLPARAWAGDAAVSDPLSLYTNVGFHDKYVFRGMTLYDGFSIQPNLGVTYDFGDKGRLNFGLWMQLPVEDNDTTVIDQYSEETTGFSDLNDDEIFSPSKKFIELDPTISYDLTICDFATWSFGHTWYTDPQKGEVVIIRGVEDEEGNFVPAAFNAIYSRGDTSEFFTGLSVEIPLGEQIPAIATDITVVKDYRKYDYLYYTLGFAQTYPVSKDKKFTVTPNVLFAWATNTPDDDAGSFSTNYDKNGLVHVNVGVKGNISADNFSVKPIFSYIFTQDTNEGPDDIVWGGFDIDFSI